MSWQPIETAPKDGTRVLLVVGDMVGEARYQGAAGDEGWWWAGMDPGDYHACVISTPPTHWMPLPAAPTEPTS